MGILSSLRLSANGDTAGENPSGEAGKETAECERQARERKPVLAGVPAEPRAERWTHKGRRPGEEDHES
jgi:hypothetical protein